MRHKNPCILSLICSLIIGAVPLFGGVKIQVVEGRPIVDGVYVNGHGPFRFLVDTGANVNLIETKLARSIRMNATFQIELGSVAGKTMMQGTDGQQILLDSVEAGGQEFLLSNLEAIHLLSVDIQGVLGQWFLSRFDYVLDLKGKWIQFGTQDRNGTRARFKMINGRPAVSTSLGDMILDSGAAALVLIGVKADTSYGSRAEMRTTAGSQQIGMVHSRPLIIEGRKIWQGEAVTLPGPSDPGVDGLLPVRLFKAIYVSNSEGYVVFD
jgi:hypothetical protein